MLRLSRRLRFAAIAPALFVLAACGRDLGPIPEAQQGLTLGNGPTEALRNGDLFENCRQALPGIEPLSEEKRANFDESALGTSQQFEISGSGDWDDNANYRRFLGLVSRAPVHETVDVSNRQYVVVVDRDDRAVGNCPVLLTDSEGKTAQLTTFPSGRIAVFPQLYGFAGPIRVTAECLSTSGAATLSLEKEDDVAVVRLDATQPELGDESLDIAFVLDVTGSMSAEIEAMKATIDAVAEEIVSAGQANVRLALVAYRDYGDSPEFETIDFTSDVESFRARIESLEAAGGGDVPEAVNEAIHRATLLNWSPNSNARLAFVIGDAPPHPNEQYSAVRSAAVLGCGGVKTFTVATTGQSLDGRYIFRQVSQMTQATHLFLLRGVSGTASDCSDQEFHTGDLHSLVIEKAEDELVAGYGDPFAIPGLRIDRDAELAAALDKCALEATRKAKEAAEAAGLDPDKVGDYLPVVK